MSDAGQNFEPLFCDLDLARRIEGAEADGGREFAATHRLLFPDVQATTLAVAGGRATFVGADSPVTQAFALGLNGEVTNDDLQRLEAFYFDRRASVNIETCPLADESLVRLLYERGYRPAEQSNVLVRRLSNIVDEMRRDAAMPASEDVAKLVAREALPDEEAVWAETVSRGFVEAEESMDMMRELSRTVFQHPHTKCFLVEIENDDGSHTIIACGSLNVHENLAGLGGASTLPEFRRRGSQTALLAHRLTYAGAHGCDLATVTTLPGSGSQRNVERWRFQVAYTRTKWLLEFS